MTTFTVNKVTSNLLGILVWLTPIGMAMYPITVTIHFCVNCFVISNMLQLINNQVTKLSLTSPTNGAFGIHLRSLQKQHFTICQAIELLNDSFGLALLVEILFLFISLTNTIMSIVLQSRNINLYALIMAVSTVVSAVINLVIICHSAESLRNQVLIL